MSVKALTWAFEQKLKPTQKIVLLALADHANDSGECWPGINKLCEKAGVSRSTLKRALEELEENGFIQRQERKRQNGSQTSNLYFLTLEGVQNEPGGSPQVNPPEPSLELQLDNSLRKRKGVETPIPDDFAPNAETIAFCKKNRPDVNIERFTLMFIESCKASDRRYVQWQNAFKKWVINERSNSNGKTFRKPAKPTSEEIFDAVTEAVELSKTINSLHH